MNLIQAEGLSKAYGEKVLLDQVSFSLLQGDKIGLVAKNGSGKTTLLNILTGKDQPDSGNCSFRSDLRLAYLEQEPLFDASLTVAQALLTGDSEINRVLRTYEELIQEPVVPGSPSEKALQEAIERMDALNAWDMELRIKQVLSRLAIGNLKAKVGSLSGGQQKRLALARILLEEADCILLDEPTNHLDIGMIEWLEGYLGRKKSSLLVVTHDRYFLDAVCNGIMELDRGKVHHYRGDYAFFLDKKQARLAAESALTERAANLLRRETEWMRRSPPARTTKSKARIDAYHGLQELAAEQAAGGTETIRMEMARLGKKILEAGDIRKEFGTLRVLDDFSYVFKRGERLGVVGPNGCGKTTLLRILTGELPPDQGRVVAGETIRFGHFRQEGLQADAGKKVIEVITDIAETITLSRDRTLTASQLLHQFHFPHAVQQDLVGKLSGGERRRLLLLTVLMRKPNFLILDEPTNDLDIETLNVLEEFLSGFAGCLLVVSHDRYFLDNLVDQLLVFEGPGRVRGYVGNYTSYRQEKLQRDALSAGQEKAARKDEPSGPGIRKTREKTKLSYKEMQEFNSLEEDIRALEQEKDLLLGLMNAGGMDPEKLLDASRRVESLIKELETKENRWLELAEWM